MKSHFWGTLTVLTTLTLTACQSATPTLAPTVAPTPTSQPAPTEAPPTAEAGPTPSVTVMDQDIAGGAVTIAEVVSDGPGWLVIHAQADGKPGPILGHSPVSSGANADVVVTIDVANATETLYAMLHTDAGATGVFEFPDGPDAPVKVGEQMVTPAFQVGVPAAGETVKIVIGDNSFTPSTITVPAGTTVVWTHAGNRPHTVTADDGLFDSGTLGAGDQFTFTFTEPGTYAYHCKIHGGPGGAGMSAVIEVQG